MVRESEFKSEDPGFDPLAGQGGEQFFSVSPSQLLFMPFYSDRTKTVCAFSGNLFDKSTGSHNIARNRWKSVNVSEC